MKMFEIITEYSNKKSSFHECATSGGTSAGAIATVPAAGAGAKVGSLFGGSYKQKKAKKK